MTPTQKVLVNTLAQVLTKAVTVLIGVGIRKLLAVYLGPAGLGEYFFVLTFATIFGSIADFGTVLITVREAAKDKVHAPSIFGNVFWLRMVLSLSAMLLAALTVTLLPPSSIPLELRNLTIFGAILIFIFSTKASLSIIFQTLLKMEQWAVPEITASVSTLLFTLLAIQSHKGILELVGSLMLGNITAIFMALFLSQRLIRIDFRPRKEVLLPLLKNAIPMGGVLVTFSIYNKLDTILLQTLRGPEVVGLYGVAYSVHDVLVLVAAYFMNAVLPILSETLNKNSEESRKRASRIFQKSFATLLILAVGMFLVVEVFAPLIVTIIASPAFDKSTETLRLLVFATFFAYLNHLTGYTLVALNQQRKFFLITLTALITNVLANLLLIPPLAQNGSAIATVLTEGIVFILTSILIYQTMGWAPKIKAIPETVKDLLMKPKENFQ